MLASAMAAPADTSSQIPLDRGPNVVLLLLDGAGREEVTRDSFGQLWSEVVTPGVMLGELTSGTAGPRLPSLQELFPGPPPGCGSDLCARPDGETLAESAVRRLRAPKGDVAVFASWERVESAIERRRGTIYLDAGPDR